MKIDCAIMSSDSNKMYLDFWPYVSKIWKLKFNIEPILLYIGDEKPEVDNEYGTIIKFSPCNNYPKYIQTLFVRYWYACSIDNVSIISDIDMFPISRYYFIDTIQNIGDDKYIHINPCEDTYSVIPSCYHVAKGGMFNDVLKLKCSFEESLSFLKKSQRAIEEKCPEYWFADEIFATEKIYSYEKKNNLVFMRRDGGQKGHRIDRSRWRYDLNLFNNGYYWDAHMIRPVEAHRTEIESFTQLVMNI